MNSFDDQSLRIQLVMLLASLPVVAALGISGLWALLRLHERPRAGWIVLGVTALSAFQLAGSSALWMLVGSFGGLLNAQYLSLAVLILNSVAEIVIWWLLLLGVFGSDPFRWRAANNALSDAEYDPQ